MKSDVLAAMLDGQKGIRREGSTYVIDESLVATMFAGSAGGELITVPKVARIDVGKEFCAFHTHKGERYFFQPDLVVGLKLEEGEDRRKTPGSAGFR
jgi:hypothetical protein